MPLYAILVREYFGARIMGTMFGAVAIALTLHAIESTCVISCIIRIPTVSQWWVIGRGCIVRWGRWIVDRCRWVVIPVRIRSIVGI
jgi:hypothetical protein